MVKRQLFGFVLLLFCAGAAFSGIEANKAEIFAGQDLHLRGGELISYQPASGEHILILSGGFSMLIGGDEFSSDEAVVWLESETTKFRGKVSVDYKAKVYLASSEFFEKGKKSLTVDLRRTIVEDGKSLVLEFDVTGEIFVTAEKREVRDVRGLDFYKRGAAAVEMVELETEAVAEPEAKEAEIVEKEKEVQVERKPELKATEAEGKKPLKREPGIKLERGEIGFRYPVNFAPAGAEPLKFEAAASTDGDIATIIGRLYVWQKRDERGGLLELQADNSVVYYRGDKLKSRLEQDKEREEVFGQDGDVKAIYLTGDVVMTEGQRTIRADEIYYDFEEQRGLVVNAEMRSFDVGRGIPIYVRASKLRRVSENIFSAEEVTVTSSEFYTPQISSTASRMIITDKTTIDSEEGELRDSSYDAEMEDVRLKVGEQTIFYWPYLRSNLERPDMPLKSVRTGYASDWGAILETEWFLSRLLGLQEPEGTESTLGLHYYGERGLASEVEIDYEREDYFGRLLGFVINDNGEDRLGRASSRKNLEPDEDIRGRLQWQHRQFLPYNWQFTAEASYLSDETFLESFYRGEYNVGKEQETIAHLKRLEDNWALSLLGKARINDFADELEELPTVEFHLTGESLFDDNVTLYSDTISGRGQQKIGDTEPLLDISDEKFTFVSHRSELDIPIWAAPFKVVPFLAGTFGLDDRSGFTTTLVDGSNTGSFGEREVWIGEAGVRVGTQLSKVYPNVKSQLWDLHQLRHIIRPQFTGVLYGESDDVVEQHDTLNFGVSQRLQTKRGFGENQRTVDWMRLDVDVTVVDEPVSSDEASPDRFIWNRTMVPLGVVSSPDIFNGDLGDSSFGRYEMWGPRRSYIGGNYLWRMSDTTAVLSDIYYDYEGGTVEQLNVGFSRMRWPNLSYYIGSRYLRRVDVLDEEGSNAFVLAATYILDPRYTVVLSQQYDFDYGASIRSELTLIRRYHRMYCGFTFMTDGSLDRQAVVLSIWPQGIPEMGMGGRRFTGQTSY